MIAGTIPPKKSVMYEPLGLLPPLLNSNFLSRNKLADDNSLQSNKRIRQLEDALKLLQARVSAEPHPLLSNQCLGTIPDTLKRKPDAPDIDTCNEFGILAIVDKGIARFVRRFEVIVS